MELFSSCPNLMVSLPLEAASTAQASETLRRQKTLFGMHKIYHASDVTPDNAVLAQICRQMAQSVFFFLLADDSCPPEKILAASDFVQQYRFTPTQPVFPLEVQEDTRKIEQIITTSPAFLELLPDRTARTSDAPLASFAELSLKNIFYRELLSE